VSDANASPAAVRCASQKISASNGRVGSRPTFSCNLGYVGFAPDRDQITIVTRRRADRGRPQCGHGMIGTVEIAFAGEPLTIFVLIAR